MRTCHTGEFIAGRRVTDFRLANGNVESVTVAFVIDCEAPEVAGQADRSRIACDALGVPEVLEDRAAQRQVRSFIAPIVAGS